MNIHPVFIIFGFVLAVLIYRLFHLDLPPGMTLFSGPPGSGKTSLCAYFVKKYTIKQERLNRRKKKLWYRALFRIRVLVALHINRVKLWFVRLRLKLRKDSKYLRTLEDVYSYNVAFLLCHQSIDCIDPKIWSNVPVLGSLQLDVEQDFGRNLLEDGIVLVDEAGIAVNNRNWKSLSPEAIRFAKLFRHYGIGSFVFFSQGLDIDITFMRLCEKIHFVSKLGKFALVRPLIRYQSIDELTGQPIDKYKYDIFGVRLVYLPPLWKFFDSYEAPFLPDKQYEPWNTKSRYSADD